MRVSTENAAGRQIGVYDCRGNKISGVVSYDTDTRDIEMIVYLLREEGKPRPILSQHSQAGEPEPVVIRAKLPGSYAIVDGQKY